MSHIVLRVASQQTLCCTVTLGQSLYLQIHNNECFFACYAIYALNNPQDREHFLDKLLERIQQEKQPLLLLGDFNSVTCTCDRTSEQLDPTTDQMKIFQQLMEDRCNSLQHMYFKNDYSSRLDYIFTSGITTSKMDKQYWGSDHWVLLTNIHFEIKERGQGYWHFNAALLRELQYVEGVWAILQEIQIMMLWLQIGNGNFSRYASKISPSGLDRSYQLFRIQQCNNYRGQSTKILWIQP